MNQRTNMKSSTRNSALSRLLWAGSLITLLCLLALVAAGQTVAKKAMARTFATPQQAAAALIDAAEKYDVAALEAILGPDGQDIIATGEPARDREQATAFAALAREQKNVA